MDMFLFLVSIVGTSNAFTSSPSTSCIRARTSLNAEVEGEMSQSLPFVPRPKHLDGSLAGDVGFE